MDLLTYSITITRGKDYYDTLLKTFESESDWLKYKQYHEGNGYTVTGELKNRKTTTTGVKSNGIQTTRRIKEESPEE